MTIGGDSGQRFSQLVRNAIADDLMTSERIATDDDVAKALFYISDDHVNAAIERYIGRCVRGPYGTVGALDSRCRRTVLAR